MDPKVRKRLIERASGDAQCRLLVLAGAGLALLSAGGCGPPIEEDEPAVLTLAVLDPTDQGFQSGVYLPFNDVRLGGRSKRLGAPRSGHAAPRSPG